MKRIYIISDKKGNFYKLPFMQYPMPVKKFINWLKKKKVISPANYFIWDSGSVNDIFCETFNKDICCYYDHMFDNGYFVKDLQTDDDLAEYNKFIKSDEYAELIKKLSRSASAVKKYKFEHVCKDDIPIHEISITQDLINEYNKQQPPLRRLHWKTDKAKIMEILQSLNPKYLLGRIEAHERNATETHPSENDIRRIENETGRHQKYSVTIKYSGYIFNVDKKTLEKEAWRRVKAGTLVARQAEELWNSPARFFRFGFRMKQNGQTYIQFMK